MNGNNDDFDVFGSPLDPINEVTRGQIWRNPGYAIQCLGESYVFCIFLVFLSLLMGVVYTHWIAR
jgi:hypothetical protein